MPSLCPPGDPTSALTGLSVHLTQTAAPARGSQSLLFLPLPSLGRAPPALTAAAARRASRAQAAHLGARGQQQLHALRLALQAGGVQGGDGVHRDLVDAGAALDQLLQPQRLALLGGLVHGRALHPEAWRGEDGVLSPGVLRPSGSEGRSPRTGALRALTLGAAACFAHAPLSILKAAGPSLVAYEGLCDSPP